LGDRAAAGPAASATFPAPATSSITSCDPTARFSPTTPSIATTVPAIGAGISTVALSVMTSTSGSSSRISCPGMTCHLTISASVVPSPISGSLTM